MRAIILDETLEVSHLAHQVLPAMGVELAFASSRQELALAFVTGRPTDLLIVNLNGELSGWEVAEEHRRARFEGKTVALVEHPAHPGLSSLRQLPRTECVVRPSPAALLKELLTKIVSETSPNHARLTTQPELSTATRSGMLGNSKPMQEIFSLIKKVAAGDSNVCVYGESGTGKELIARAIHYSSARRDRPLITLDCAAVPEGLMESHLFGHVKGAFTGAVAHREGVFSLAHTGTLFIDELCELSLPLQAKLLRIIQTREIFKVGGTKPTRTDVRLIMATNKDPKKAVDSGTFREDLYYRVAVVMVKVPPLRQRPEDIPLLVEHFLRKFSAVYNKPVRGVTPPVMDRLTALPWPGNVRQLENFIEQAVVLSEKESLTLRDLPADEYPLSGGGPPARVQLEAGLPLREVERRYILHTLQKAQGNRTLAAQLLRISLRSLQYKLKAYLEEAKDTHMGGTGSAYSLEHTSTQM